MVGYKALNTDIRGYCISFIISNKNISYDLIFKSTNTFTYHKTNCSQFFKKRQQGTLFLYP